MGSLRNPVGPLPSTIYWRRRAVLLCLLALAVALVVWALTSKGGGGGKGSSAPTGSHTPVTSITPGPDPSGTHISGRPSGRDTAPPSGTAGGPGGTAGSGADGGTDGGSSAGTQGGAAADGGTGTASDAGATAGPSSTGGPASAGTEGTTGAAAPLPAGSTLPTCDPARVQLTLTSVSRSYSPGDTPAFQLRAANSGDTSCKIDFGPRSAVFTVTATPDNDHVWASDDCPATGAYLLQVPAHSSTTFTERWTGKTSSPNCAAPKGRQAGPGTYLVQAKLPGYPVRQASFVLSAD